MEAVISMCLFLLFSFPLGETVCQKVKVSGVDRHHSLNGEYTLYSATCYNNNVWRKYVGDLGIVSLSTNQTIDYYYLYFVKEPAGSDILYTWNLGDDLCNETHVHAYAAAASQSSSPTDVTRWLEAKDPFDMIPTRRRKRHLTQAHHITRRAADEFVTSKMTVICRAGVTTCQLLSVSGIKIHSTYNGLYTFHSAKCFNNNVWRRYIGDLGLVDTTTNQTLDYFYIYYVKEPPGSSVQYTWNLGDDLCNGTHVAAYAAASAFSTSPAGVTGWLESRHQIETIPARRRKRHLHNIVRRAASDFVDSSMTVRCEGNPAVPDNCFRGPWTSWSSCSRTCGSGIKTRIRQGVACPDLSDTKLCINTNCFRTNRPPSVPDNCFRGPWTSWSSCSRTCGSGIKTRIRQGVACPDLSDTKSCINNNCFRTNRAPSASSSMPEMVMSLLVCMVVSFLPWC